MDKLPSDIFQHILSYNNNDFLFSGVLNKNLCVKKPQKTFIESLVQSKSRLKETLEYGIGLPYNILDILASCNKPQLLDIVLENSDIEWDHFCIESAIWNRSKEFIKYIHDSGYFWVPENAFIYSIENRDLELAQFMFDSGFGFPDERCMMHAQINEYIEIIEWIMRIENSDEYMMNIMIKNDDIENVIKMWEREFQFCQMNLITSCVNNSIKCFHFFLDLGIIPGKKEYTYACHMKRDYISNKIMEIIEF